jgi:hypothetical protein
MFLANAFIFSFSTHKQSILSQLYTTALLWFPLNPYILSGFEPGSTAKIGTTIEVGLSELGNFLKMLDWFLTPLTLLVWVWAKIFLELGACWVLGKIFLESGGCDHSVLAGPNWSRVARWFVFKQKIPILVKFGGPWNGNCCYILWPFGIFYGHLV